MEALYYFSVQLLVNAQFWCVTSDLKGLNELRSRVESNVISSKIVKKKKNSQKNKIIHRLVVNVTGTANGHGKAYSKAVKIFAALKKWILVMFLCTVSFMLTPPLIITIYNCYTEDAIEPSSWNLPFLLAYGVPMLSIILTSHKIMFFVFADFPFRPPMYRVTHLCTSSALLAC